MLGVPQGRERKDVRARSQPMASSPASSSRNRAARDSDPDAELPRIGSRLSVFIFFALGSMLFTLGLLILLHPAIKLTGDEIRPIAKPKSGPDADTRRPANLALNPGFESQPLGPWRARGGVTLARERPFSGSFAARIGAGGARLQQKIAGLTPNTAYRLRAYLQCDEGDSELGVEDFGGETMRVKTEAREYREVELVFTTGPEHRSATIFWEALPKTGFAYADDFLVHPAPAAPAEAGPRDVPEGPDLE